MTIKSRPQSGLFAVFARSAVKSAAATFAVLYLTLLSGCATVPAPSVQVPPVVHPLPTHAMGPAPQLAPFPGMNASREELEAWVAQAAQAFGDAVGDRAELIDFILRSRPSK